MFISNFLLGGGISFAGGNGLRIKRNQLLGTIPRLGKVFDISFSVKVTKWIPRWTNILHMTIGGNNARYGSRIPGIFVKPSYGPYNNFKICYAVMGIRNWCYHSPNYHLNKWVNIRIQQVRSGRYYWYNIYMNGQRKLHRKNTRPRVFHNVKLYAGDPWYSALPGFIKNIRVGVTG